MCCIIISLSSVGHISVLCENGQTYHQFLPPDATQRTVMPRYIVCLSVCPSVPLSVTFR